MLAKVITIVIGVLGGLAVGIQSPLIGGMGQRVGAASSSLILSISGAVFSVLLLLARGGENIGAWRTLPWYMLVCGIFGVVIALTITYTIPKVGAGVAATLIIIGQLMAGMLVDHFGLFGVPVRPVDISRAVAVLFLLVGGYLMVR